MINKAYYQNNLPDDLYLFHQPFWLNTVHGDNWDVALVVEDNKLVASMPYCYNQIKDGINITMPLFTLFLGPYIVNDKVERNVSKINYEMNILANLLKQLPAFKRFGQSWRYNYQNWLPFYWNGFKQTSRYTYVIEDTGSIEGIWNSFRTEARTEIRRGEKIFKITENRTNREFYELVCKTWSRQNILPPASFDFYDKLINVLKQNNAGKVYFAEYDNKPISTLLVAWDKLSMYSLVDGTDTDSKYNGAQSYIFWNAIKFASETNKQFDFDGSMVPSIEKYLRKFGGTQRTYFAISKNNKTNKDFVLTTLSDLKMVIRMIVLYFPLKFWKIIKTK